MVCVWRKNGSLTGWFFLFLFVCMENYSGSVIITQEKSVLQKTAHSHIQKEETQKLIRRKLAVGWKLKVTRDSMLIIGGNLVVEISRSPKLEINL